jgi:hypothetical protein
MDVNILWQVTGLPRDRVLGMKATMIESRITCNILTVFICIDSLLKLPENGVNICKYNVRGKY